MGNAQKADGSTCDRTPLQPQTILIKHTALTPCTHTHTPVHTRPIVCAVRLATSHTEKSKKHCLSLVPAAQEQEYLEANG